MNAELQVAIDTAIDAMHTTKVLFDLGEDHILSSALRKLVVAVDAEDVKSELWVPDAEDAHEVKDSPHATVNRDGFNVPLIGVPPGAVMEECDLCHEEHPLRDLTWTGTQMLCEKCRRTK